MVPPGDVTVIVGITAYEELAAGDAGTESVSAQLSLASVSARPVVVTQTGSTSASYPAAAISAVLSCPFPLNGSPTACFPIDTGTAAMSFEITDAVSPTRIAAVWEFTDSSGNSYGRAPFCGSSGLIDVPALPGWATMARVYVDSVNNTACGQKSVSTVGTIEADTYSFS
jgi:hypothetical protein